MKAKYILNEIKKEVKNPMSILDVGISHLFKGYTLTKKYFPNMLNKNLIQFRENREFNIIKKYPYQTDIKSINKLEEVCDLIERMLQCAPTNIFCFGKNELFDSLRDKSGFVSTDDDERLSEFRRLLVDNELSETIFEEQPVYYHMRYDRINKSIRIDSPTMFGWDSRVYFIAAP